MFLPIGSNLPFFRVPLVTVVWMCLSTFLFFALWLGEKTDVLHGTDNILAHFAVVPGASNELWKYFSYQWWHASLAHLLSNMWYLLIFGWILESAIGPFRFLILSWGAGALAVVSESLVEVHNMMPVIGASGAVAFILGAVTALFPQCRVRLLLLLFPVPNTPASFYIPLRYLSYAWLLLQVSGVAYQAVVEARPVAYVTHLSGFLVGLLFGLFSAPKFKKKFFDIELSGKDLRSFYESLEDFRESRLEKAGEKLVNLSTAHRWNISLQMKLLGVAMEWKHRSLSDHLWRSVFLPLLSLRRRRDIMEILSRYKSSFGELPPIEATEELRLKKILKKDLPLLLASV